MNGGKIGEKQLPAEFAKFGYGILIAAGKYQTGFDQPLLQTLYVEKLRNRFHPNDELFWDQVREDATAGETVRSAGEANTSRQFRLRLPPQTRRTVINRMDRNSAQAVRFLDNPEIRDVITRLLRDQVYDRIQDQSKARAANA
jgi:hypothetical protein